jgi:hypothetical protein
MNDETTPNPKPDMPNDPLEQLLWKLEYAVDEAPQLAPESLVQKSLAMAALWQVQASREIAWELQARHPRAYVKAEARQIEAALILLYQNGWALHPDYQELLNEWEAVTGYRWDPRSHARKEAWNHFGILQSDQARPVLTCSRCLEPILRHASVIDWNQMQYWYCAQCVREERERQRIHRVPRVDAACSPDPGQAETPPEE